MNLTMWTLCLCTLALLPELSWANSGPPPRKTKDNAPITITYAADAKQRPTLYLPKKFLDAAAAESNAQPRADASPLGRTLFAGLAMSAAMVTGGLWLVRRSGSNGAKGLLALFIITGLLGLTAFLPDATGDVRPPPVRKVTELQFDGKTAKLGVDVVIDRTSDTIVLVLPPALKPEAPKKDAPK